MGIDVGIDVGVEVKLRKPYDETGQLTWRTWLVWSNGGHSSYRATATSLLVPGGHFPRDLLFMLAVGRDEQMSRQTIRATPAV